MSAREPWLSVILSSLCPGAGQIYAGKIVKGIAWLIAFLALFLPGFYCFFVPDSAIRWGIQLVGLATLLQFVNLFDAYYTARKVNSDEFEQTRVHEKDPWKAVFLSSIFLGLGHAYLGRWISVLCFWLAAIGKLSAI